MIQKIYIIRDCGICIFNLDFITSEVKNKAKSVDPDLFSCFFSAMFTFMEEFIGKADYDNINHLSIKGVMFYFAKIENLYYIIETDAINERLTNDDYNEIVNKIHELVKNSIEAGAIEIEGSRQFISEEFESEIRTIISQSTQKCQSPSLELIV
jgi:hypothetical protein